MEQFSDWNAEITKGMEEYNRLLDEARASSEERETEARLNREEACRFADETSDSLLLAMRATDYFSNSTNCLSRLLTILTNTSVRGLPDSSAIHFFFENLYDLAFLINFIVQEIESVIAGSYSDPESNGAEYSAFSAKIGVQALVGAIFAVTNEVFSTDHALIEEIMTEANCDMTVYDVMRLIKESYLLIEPKADFVRTEELEDISVKKPHRKRTKKKRKQKTEKGRR